MPKKSPEYIEGVMEDVRILYMLLRVKYMVEINWDRRLARQTRKAVLRLIDEALGVKRGRN